jgi:hypothetical protein
LFEFFYGVWRRYVLGTSPCRPLRCLQFCTWTYYADVPLDTLFLDERNSGGAKPEMARRTERDCRLNQTPTDRSVIFFNHGENLRFSLPHSKPGSGNFSAGGRKLDIWKKSKNMRINRFVSIIRNYHSVERWGSPKNLYFLYF